MKTKNKDFDCVAMKHEGARALYEKIKDMTVEEELEFWRKGTEELLAWQRKLRIEQGLDPETGEKLSQ